MEYFYIFFLESLSSFLKYHCLYCSNIKVSLISWILRECHTVPLQFPQHDSVRDITWFKFSSVLLLNSVLSVHTTVRC